MNFLIIMGFSYVLITGLQILCSRAVGSGESKQVVSMFSAGFIFLAFFGAMISVLCVLFLEPMIAFLTGGIHDRTVILNLRDYISGYSYRITFQILYGFLMVFLPLNNCVNLSYQNMAGININTVMIKLSGK